MDAPTERHLPRRQAVLFLVAILVPCLVLVALGLRLMAQERQLDNKRRAEARQLLVVQVRQELLSRTRIGRGAHVSPLDRAVLAERTSGYADAFRRLQAAGITDDGLAGRLVQAAGSRNVVPHAHETVDMARVHRAAASGPADLRAFIDALDRAIHPQFSDKRTF